MTGRRRWRAVRIVLAGLGLALSRRVEAAAGIDAGQDKYQVEARVMFWADASERQSVPDQAEAVTDFLVRRVRLIIQGTPSKSLSFYFQVGEDNIGAKVLTPDASIRIKDAFITYRAATALQLTAGQFKIPFLRANLESGFNQVLVDRGALPALRPSREGSRDLGVMAWGNMRSVQYRVALFDGSDQEARNTTSSLRVSTRLAFNWFAHETGLAYTGSYLGRTRVLQIAGQVDAQNSRLDPRDESGFQARARDYRALAVEAFFDQPLVRAAALTVDGAWFDRADDYVDAGIAARREQGYYVQPAFLLPGHIGPGRLQFAFRREDWNDNRGILRRSISRTTGGAAYYLKGHDRKIQMDYTRKRETPEIRNNEVRLSLVLVF